MHDSIGTMAAIQDFEVDPPELNGRKEAKKMRILVEGYYRDTCIPSLIDKIMSLNGILEIVGRLTVLKLRDAGYIGITI